MTRFTQNRKFHPAAPGEIFETSGGSMHIRAEGWAGVYTISQDEDEVGVLAGCSYEPFTVEVPAGRFAIKCAGDVYIAYDAVVQPTYEPTGEVFTTLDRPSPMSPEMQAIHRLARQNELEREATRNQLTRMRDENARLHSKLSGREDSVVLEEASEADEEEVADDVLTSGRDAEEQVGAKDAAVSDATGDGDSDGLQPKRAKTPRKRAPSDPKKGAKRNAEA